MSQSSAYIGRPVLFWNNNGRIACERHAPAKGTDTWKSERWSKVPQAAYASGFIIKCEGSHGS